MRLVLLALCLIASPAMAWDVDGPSFLLSVSESPIEPIPPVPNDGSGLSMAAAKANYGSSFWGYLRDHQATIAWFSVTILPDDSNDDLVWGFRTRFRAILADSSLVPATFVTTARCGKETLCDLVTVPARIAWRDLAIIHPQTGISWRGYAGVPRERIRLHRVVGFTLEESP